MTEEKSSHAKQSNAMVNAAEDDVGQRDMRLLDRGNIALGSAFHLVLMATREDSFSSTDMLVSDPQYLARNDFQ